MAGLPSLDDYERSEPPRPTLAERFPMLHVPVTAEFGPEDVEQLQFSLRELFFLTTAAALMLALFRNLGVFGAVWTFITAFLLTVVALPWLAPWQNAWQCKIFDFVWGVVMPVVTLVFDPLLFKEQMSFGSEGIYFGEHFHIHGIAYFAWPLLAFQIVGFLLAPFAGRSARRIAPFLAGVLAVGLTVGLFLIVILTLPAILFLAAYGLGLLGFTPLLACIAFQRRMRLMNELGKEVPERFTMLLAGILVSVLVPLAIGTVLTIIVYLPVA
ncbi:MAG: hypothetical protein K8R36_17825 [Planctomycetales bacterium]|nr:hypothetical protein [Planctomycetales bacterium]